MKFFAEPSLVALLIQASAAALMFALGFVLSRSMSRRPLTYWTYGWAALALGLMSLWLSFEVAGVAPFTEPAYMFGEYLFGYLVFAGCRDYAQHTGLPARERWLLPLGVALAVGLSSGGRYDFNVFFVFHTLCYGYLFFAAFRAVRPVKTNDCNRAGLRVLKTALALLALDYVHYAPLFFLAARGAVPTTLPYLTYSPLYDLILLVLLMFGIVMTTFGDVQHELQTANAELADAHRQLEARSRVDHLTSALNRRALDALIAGGPGQDAVASGTVVVADLDNLKSINDRFGHAAGDAAIRAVASAIRASIGDRDLLFRWGGDEFLVIVADDERGARAKLGALNDRLPVTLEGADQPVDVSVTIGFASFDASTSLEWVIAQADAAMYGRKRQSA